MIHIYNSVRSKNSERSVIFKLAPTAENLKRLDNIIGKYMLMLDITILPKWLENAWLVLVPYSPLSDPAA